MYVKIGVIVSQYLTLFLMVVRYQLLLQKLKRDKCAKQGEVNEDAVILSAEHAPASEKLSAPVKGPKKKAKKKLSLSKKENPNAGVC